MYKLYLDGSVWCNLSVALYQVDQIYRQEVKPLGLSMIEWYVLRALYEEDGQSASRVAKAVGRPTTSFTPLLDILESKGLIERRNDRRDRRVVKIYLTEQGRALEEQVVNSAERIEGKIRQQLAEKDWREFEIVMVSLQSMKPQL